MCDFVTVVTRMNNLEQGIHLVLQVGKFLPRGDRRTFVQVSHAIRLHSFKQSCYTRHPRQAPEVPIPGQSSALYQVDGIDSVVIDGSHDIAALSQPWRR